MADESERTRAFLRMVGEAVKGGRQGQSLSLRSLSAKTGLSHRAIFKVEHGETDARLSTLFLLSEALNCTVADFVYKQPVEGHDGVVWSLQGVPEEFGRIIDDGVAAVITNWLKSTLTGDGALDDLAEHVRSKLILRMALKSMSASPIPHLPTPL